MPDLMALVVGLKTVSLLLGGVITYVTGKTYRRTGTPAFRALAVGFGLLTLGALVAGFADQVLQVDTNTALVVESSITALGLLVITYSLFRR
ncbi:MAG: hypothetical protein ABEI96_02570 [Haloarculaceae archaeon]